MKYHLDAVSINAATGATVDMELTISASHATSVVESTFQLVEHP